MRVTLHPPRTNNVQLDTLLPAPTSGSPSNGGRSLLFLPLCRCCRRRRRRHRHRFVLLPSQMRRRVPILSILVLVPPPFALVAFSSLWFAIHHCPCASFVHGIPSYIPSILCFFFFSDLRNSRSSRTGKHRPVRTHLGFADFGCV